MKLSEYAINELVDYIRGEDNKSKYKSGKELVSLFNKYGSRDLYDFQNGGLPKLQDNQRNNTSRKDYTFDRLKGFNNKLEFKKLIEDVVNEEGVPDIQLTVSEINKIIVKEKYLLQDIGGKFEIIGAEIEEEVIEVEVSFEDIQSKILSELNKAKFTVWVAVAWFTNKILYDKLVELKQNGVNVQVLIIDDVNNRKSGLDFEAIFETRRIPEFGYFNNNKMHNKFCIIDLNTVINGSYNWSKAAEYNNENINIIKSRNAAEKFSMQFIKLKTS